MTLRPLDFESSASAYSATLADRFVWTEKSTEVGYILQGPTGQVFDFFSQVANSPN